ncbi:MAG: ribosome biogenesis GTPase Der [Acidobacteria bacterium RIFCSPLOWO2_12_FULL_67_14]|nr:MAG: ribosome biogenesis GTPase Der [Acidobacteria bacterium RIFCSPLOWO2_02_FULL_67_21]OFW36165.1 MAG: ribosome biogenesis GTPase Der [Acidobacteria bacterium RIFCSPLOWO2_12_FULL_67_14]
MPLTPRRARRRLPSVVLVGRPNVGKSTLFNRLTGQRRAIVTPVAGTTRDVIALPAEWRGVPFELVDTGGMFGASEDPLHELVLERGHRAVADADLVVLVVDGREGLMPGDREIARAIREASKPAVLAINKTDDRRAQRSVLEFYQLGFDPVFEISAEHGQGTGDLLDAVVEQLGPASRTARAADEGAAADAPAAASEINIAVIGRPNAGKSSLVNRLLREERMIVSEMPGTTRDSVDSLLTWHRRRFRLVDTAGIRRPGRVARSGQIESISVLLARRAMQSADVAVVVIDAVEGATDQDAAIAGEAERTGCGVIVAANKWDLMKGRGPEFVKEFDEALRRQLKFLDYAPVMHVSAVTGERTPRLLEMIDRVAASRMTRVKTAELNAFIKKITAQQPPPHQGRSEVRIMYAAQAGVAPPTFVLFTNVAIKFHFSYERFLVNRLRDEFGFMGTPIRLHVRRRRK